MADGDSIEPHQFIYLMLAFGLAARPAAILDLTTFQVDCDARLIRLNPAGRAQNKKRRPTLPICDALLPWLRHLPPGPVVNYRGRKLADSRMMFKHLTGRAARRMRQDAATMARDHRRAGRRNAAWAEIYDGRRRAGDMLEITAYTIRHTVAVEMRKRGVPVWEVAGFLGHSSGYKTTERYAKFGPDHLGGAVGALDDYFAVLGLVAAPLRAGPSVACELRVNNLDQETRKLLRNLVEPTGIEPVTSTMPL
jgi:integrase